MAVVENFLGNLKNLEEEDENITVMPLMNKKYKKTKNSFSALNLGTGGQFIKPITTGPQHQSMFIT